MQPSNPQRSVALQPGGTSAADEPAADEPHGDEHDEAERAALRSAISRSLVEANAGQFRTAAEVLESLRR